MLRRMALELSVMASLREFEEKPGAARAGDGRGQPPVCQHHVEGREREAPQPGVGVVRREPIALAEGVEEVAQGNKGRYTLDPAGQDGDRIVDAGQHDHEVHGGPRRSLGARAEEHDQAAHEEPMAAMRRKTTTPRATPTSQEPTAMWRMPMGVRNWCFMDFDQMSKSTA